MFASSLARLAGSIGITQPRELETVDREQGWAEIAEVGLLALRQRDDGVPLASGVEVLIAAEALGGALAPQPFTGCGVMATELMALAQAPQEWIDTSTSGSGRCGVMLSRDLSRLATIDDTEAVAWDVDGADHVLALAPGVEGPRLARLSLKQGFVRADSTDLTRKLMRRDGALLEPEIDGEVLDEAAFDRWLALALVALGGDITGALRSAHAAVVAFTKERVQYGVPIGSFQAVQHMCAEMLVQIEGAHTINAYAAWAVEALEPAEALFAARTAKAYCSAVALPVAETVMQVYGGIGQTWEHIAHVVTRRVMMDAKVFGDEAEQLERIADRRLTHNA
ncbi:acyl-CoA dehydrogenase family protein [Paraburkholderia sp. HP33-1]|uniref:acyl-CoA dehydrogenase family protein n=1 Tax=Paraburkholderia sp. HP33-1 TaxID=2883243 RepID=UPI001F44EBE1|nr:acyl-CoA dehydrogenase family protein [Paraburkholderia sp. HP33-1]